MNSHKLNSLSRLRDVDIEMRKCDKKDKGERAQPSQSICLIKRCFDETRRLASLGDPDAVLPECPAAIPLAHACLRDALAANDLLIINPLFIVHFDISRLQYCQFSAVCLMPTNSYREYT